MKMHVQVERAAKTLDDGHRPGPAIRVPRCLGPLPVEAEHCTCVDRQHSAAEIVIPSKPIAKLEGKAQHPLSNRCAREDVVDEMRRPLSHPAASAARAEASTFAGERDQPIGATARTAKPGKPMG
jgi:hypothetical protein